MVMRDSAHEEHGAPVRRPSEDSLSGPASRGSGGRGGGGIGYYAGADEIARRLEEAGLTPPRAAPHGRRAEEFCRVEALHPDTWPEGAVLCVEVVHFPSAEYRWRIGREDPPDAAEHRRTRLRAVADALRALGYTVEAVDRGGWLPGQQALRVYASEGSPRRGGGAG